MGEDFKDAEGKWDLGKIMKQYEAELGKVSIPMRGEDVKMSRTGICPSGWAKDGMISLSCMFPEFTGIRNMDWKRSKP